MTAPAEHRPPRHCPVCHDDLAVTRLACRSCGTELSGTFATCACCGLDEEDRALLEVFVTSRGNMKEVERRLGVSYATARSRIDQLAERLYPRPGPTTQLQVLEALARGEIDVDTALKAFDEEPG